MKSRITQNDLIRVSYNLFRERGYDNVSVMDICKAAGITKPTFYKYVASKDALLHLFYLGADYDTLRQVDSLEGISDYLEQVWLMITVTMHRSRILGPEIYSNYLVNCFENHVSPNKFAQQFKPRILSAIKKAQTSGQMLNASSPELIFEIAVNTGIGICSQWCFGAADFDPLERFRSAMFVILRPNPNLHNLVLRA